MSYAGALAAITRTPAEVFNLESAGRIVEGAAADWVLWNGDPLELSTWPVAVMTGGKWVDLTSRQTQLMNRYRNLSDGPPGYR